MNEKHEVYKGDDWKFDFQFTLEGSPIVISTLQEVRACLKGDTAAVEVTLTGGEISSTVDSDGKGVIKFPRAITPNVKKGVQNLSVTIKDASGDESTQVIKSFLSVFEREC